MNTFTNLKKMQSKVDEYHFTLSVIPVDLTHLSRTEPNQLCVVSVRGTGFETTVREVSHSPSEACSKALEKMMVCFAESV